jgi:hypothetical protein
MGVKIKIKSKNILSFLLFHFLPVSKVKKEGLILTPVKIKNKAKYLAFCHFSSHISLYFEYQFELLIVALRLVE